MDPETAEMSNSSGFLLINITIDGHSGRQRSERSPARYQIGADRSDTHGPGNALITGEDVVRGEGGDAAVSMGPWAFNVYLMVRGGQRKSLTG